MAKIKHYENIHIPLWLLKDFCWMLHWKVPGMIMVIPTILVALIITIKYFREDSSDEEWIHLAVLFWICGNSYWMGCEFFDREDLKNYAGFAFVAGMLSAAYFYTKHYLFSKKNL
jgi:hypothetical protein